MERQKQDNLPTIFQFERRERFLAHNWLKATDPWSFPLAADCFPDYQKVQEIQKDCLEHLDWLLENTPEICLETEEKYLRQKAVLLVCSGDFERALQVVEYLKELFQESSFQILDLEREIARKVGNHLAYLLASQKMLEILMKETNLEKRTGPIFFTDENKKGEINEQNLPSTVYLQMAEACFDYAKYLLFLARNCELEKGKKHQKNGRIYLQESWECLQSCEISFQNEESLADLNGSFYQASKPMKKIKRVDLYCKMAEIQTWLGNREEAKEYLQDFEEKAHTEEKYHTKAEGWLEHGLVNRGIVFSF